MITLDKEFFYKSYYFFLKENKNDYSFYFSCEDTLTEARKKDEVVKIPKDKLNKIEKYLEKVLKTKKKKSTKEMKSEIEELVDGDGSFMNSKIPILDPKMHPRKTMDQTIAMAVQPSDIFRRGYSYRSYFGEEDMSKAFGYEETKDLPPKETIKKLKKMGVEDPVGRAEEMGKVPKLDKKKKEGADMRIRLQEKEKIEELQKRKAIKVLEDIIVNKKNQDNSEVSSKEKKVSSIIKKQINSLMKQAEKQGMSKKDIIKLLGSE